MLRQKSLEEKLRPFFSTIQTTPPNPKDERATEVLVNYLDEVAPLETESERALREQLLLGLQSLMVEWVRSACIKRGVPEEDAPTGSLFVSGSYRLGVNQKGGDLDTILVVPVHVTREDFFDTSDEGLCGRLMTHASVSSVLAIPTAKVPLIKVVWEDIEVDVLFARLQGNKLPRTLDDLLDDTYLKGADEGTVLSLNGPRVTHMMTKLYPDGEKFKVVLRCLRLWGKRKGIYSNKMGFLGGVNFAILATFICQLYPKETPSKLFQNMFSLLSVWNWPTPIQLNHPYDGIEVPVQQWDKFVGRDDKMPIITPAYPNTNSSYNVTNATLKVMRREFERGLADVRRVMSSPEPVTAKDWARVFAESDFFFRYKTFVSVVASAPNDEDLKKWTGYIESRVRKLVENLERAPLFDVYPFPASFDATDAGPFARRWFVGVVVDSFKARAYAPSAQSGAVSIEGAVDDFLNSITMWKERLEGMNANIVLLKFKDVLKRFPELYNNVSIKEAVTKHIEIQADTKARLEKIYIAPTLADNAASADKRADAGADDGAEARAKRARASVVELIDLTALSPLQPEAPLTTPGLATTAAPPPGRIAPRAVKVEAWTT